MEPRWEKTKISQGLTLVEIVLTITIVGIIASGAMLYIRQVMDLWSYSSFRNEVVSPARIALERLARDIRQINNNASVYFANSTKFQFSDTNNVNIAYYLNNTDLMRNNDSLASGVRNLSYIYYNLTNQPIASPKVAPQTTDIKRINVQFNVFSGNLNKTMETQVWPRNFGG
jgi:prepilin-type N-terminal cleavage/methylation domain-containing protein